MPHKYRSRYALVSYSHNPYADVYELGKVQEGEAHRTCVSSTIIGIGMYVRRPTMEPSFVKKNTAISRLLPLEFRCSEGHFAQVDLILTLF